MFMTHKRKWTTKCLAWVLVFVLAFTSCEWSMNASAAETEQTEETSVVESSGEAQLVGEITELRGEATKQFLMDDGTVSVVQYETDVHYQDETGEWQEIDNSLTDAESEDDADASGYSNQKGKVKVKFAKNPNANFLVRIMQGEHHIFFSAKDTLKEAEGAKVLEVSEKRNEKDASMAKQMEVENIHSGVVYENIFQGTDVEYILSGSSLKENIIVKEKQDSYEYTFEVKTNKIDIRKEEDGSISFLKEGTEEVLYVIPVMYMWDAEGVESDAIEVEISTKNKKSTLTIRADVEWMNAEERAFPVTIDPTLEATSTSTGSEARIVRNMYVAQGNPTAYTSGYGRGFLGYDGSSDKTYRLFVQFKTLPIIPESSVIAGAKFYYAHEAYDDVGMSELTIAAKEVTGSWAWGGRVTWNAQPPFSSTILDYQVLSDNTVGKYVGWDITKIIKNHYENKDNTTNATSAFVLVGTEEGNYAYNHLAKANVIQENSAGFFSGAQPILVIAYRDTRGLEDYYTYQTQGLGKAGTGYVGDYTKELTLIRPIFETRSSAMPFQLNLVYNSSLEDKYFGSSAGLNTKNYINMRLGSGWKLNIQETVIEKTISGKKHLVYNDSDGTDHYFPLESGNAYKDEDGLKLTIVKSTSPVKYTMTDEKGNQKIFHNGFLSSIMDTNGNAVHLLYNNAEYSASGAWYANTGSANRVTKIVQINKGQSSPTVIATFDYKNTTFVHAVTDYAGRVYNLNYTQATGTDAYNMTKIVDPDNTYARYDYYLVNSHKVNKLARTYDSESKLGIQYTYKVTNHASKLSGFGEIRWTSDTAYVQGKAVDMTGTEPLQVYYRDRGLDCAADTKDDIWTYYTFDNAGRTISQVSMDSSRTHYYGASATAYSSASNTASAHKILSDVVIGTGGVNLLKNGSAEIISDLTANGWTDSKTVSEDTESQMILAFDGNGAVRTGTKSFRVTMKEGALPDSEGNLKASFITTAALKSGITYTFSGYFKNTESENFIDKSRAYLEVLNSSGIRVSMSAAISEPTSEQIEDGWNRMTVSFTPSAAGTYTFAASTSWIYGTSSFDDLQLEEGSAASSYNYLVNGDVEWSDGWSFSSGASRVTSTAIHGSYAVKIVGDTKTKRTASITVPLNISSDNTLVLSGWAQASSVADITRDKSSERAFGLETVLTYSDNTTETHYVSFDGSSSHLQYTSLNIVPKKAGSTIKNAVVQCVYGKNANTAYFDNISLKKEPVACYKYDNDGNVVAVSATDNERMDFAYSAGNLIKTQSESNGVYDYTYDDKHNLTKVSNDGVDMLLTYDSMGHVKTTTVQNTEKTENKTISTAASYSSDGNYLLSQTDSLGGVTSYTVNEIGLTESVTDAAGNTTVYGYDMDNNRLESVTLEDGTSVSYVYVDGMLDTIVRKSLLPDEETEEIQEYYYVYDEYDNVVAVMVGYRVLVAYDYMPNNGPLTRINYYNDYQIEYEYDVLGRVVAEKHDGDLKYRYFYGSEGALSRQEELNESGDLFKTIGYEYDSLGRLIRSWEEELKDGIQVRTLKTEHLYDTSNRLVKQSYDTEGSESRSESYVYDSDDGTLSGMTTASGDTLSYTYDYLKRLQRKSDGARSTAYIYTDVGDTGTSTQVSGISWSGLADSLSLEYEYDALGNITKIIENGEILAEYAYDRQSQLISEKLPQSGLEYVYSYDTGGNIRSITTTENGTSSKEEFYYEDVYNWKDLLAATDADGFIYDELGNPIYYNNGEAWVIGWEKARDLIFSFSSLGRGIVTYTYDSSGMRESKTNDEATHNYVYLGDLLVEETWGDNKLEFSYDEQGRPYSVDYNGTTYYYVLNLQGDVLRIVDADGNTQAEYTYNAWGKILETSGSNEIKDVNPLRYRGYYYDVETGFYYLNSRYYDPEICRFINADTADILGVSGDLYDKNLYTYCDNNPVTRRDVSGYAWETIFDIASLAASVAEVMAKPSDPWAWAGLVGDVVDVALPFVTGVGEVTRAARTTVRVISDVDDVVETSKVFKRTSGVADEVRKSTGVYVVLYETGQNYVGKGGFSRAITSETEHMSTNNKVKGIIWAPTRTKENAFISEYLLQTVRSVGKTLKNTFNKIWSPGKSLLK